MALGHTWNTHSFFGRFSTRKKNPVQEWLWHPSCGQNRLTIVISLEHTIHVAGDFDFIYFFTLFRIKCSQLAYDPNRYARVSSSRCCFLSRHCWGHGSRINVNVSMRYTHIHSGPSSRISKADTLIHIRFGVCGHCQCVALATSAQSEMNHRYWCARAISHHFRINQFHVKRREHLFCDVIRANPDGYKIHGNWESKSYQSTEAIAVRYEYTKPVFVARITNVSHYQSVASNATIDFLLQIRSKQMERPQKINLMNWFVSFVHSSCCLIDSSTHQSVGCGCMVQCLHSSIPHQSEDATRRPHNFLLSLSSSAFRRSLLFVCTYRAQSPSLSTWTEWKLEMGKNTFDERKCEWRRQSNANRNFFH